MHSLSLPRSLQFSFLSWLCFAYLFLNALPRTTAAVNVLIIAIALSISVLCVRKQFRVDLRSPITISTLIFCAIALTSSFLSPYWEESIKPIRRDLVPFFIVFCALTGNMTEQKSKEDLAKATLWSLIASYIARLLLACANWWAQGFQHDSYTIDREAAPFVDFFAINSPLFLPLLIVALLYWRLNKAWQLMLTISVLAALVLVGIAAVRTALLCALLVSFYQVAPFLWKRKWLVLGCVVIAGSISFVAFKPQLERAAPKYATIFQPITYKENGSIVERYAIWRATLEMVETRPLLGYGLGWKKLHDIAYTEGFYDQWKKRSDWLDQWGIRYFDQTGYGGTNPHNLFVQILFETGALGLLTYCSVLIAMGIVAFKSRQSNQGDWVWPCISASLLAYLIVNLMNGIWLTSGSTLGLLIATELVRQSRSSKTFVAAS